MSEKPQVHPQEPSEGGEQDVPAPGANRAPGKEEAAQEAGTEDRSRQHPQKPAEGAEEDVEDSGADRARDV